MCENVRAVGGFFVESKGCGSIFEIKSLSCAIIFCHQLRFEKQCSMTQVHDGFFVFDVQNRHEVFTIVDILQALSRGCTPCYAKCRVEYFIKKNRS